MDGKTIQCLPNLSQHVPPQMPNVQNRVKILPKSLTVWVGCTNVTDDRQRTDTIAVPLTEHKVVTFGYKSLKHYARLWFACDACRYTNLIVWSHGNKDNKTRKQKKKYRYDLLKLAGNFDVFIEKKIKKTFLHLRFKNLRYPGKDLRNVHPFPLLTLPETNRLEWNCGFLGLKQTGTIRKYNLWHSDVTTT